MLPRRPLVVLLVPAALAAAGCGGGGGEPGAGGGAGIASASLGTSSRSLQGPILAGARSAKGTVVLCAGRDRRAQTAAARAFNAANGRLGVRLRVRSAASASGRCDIRSADITRTAALAARGHVLDLSDYVSQRAEDFIPSTLGAVRYQGRYWGVPQQTGAALLYHRTDRVAALPATWQAVYADAKREGGIVYQGAASENLTTHFLELAYAAGGHVLSDDGTTSELDSSANRAALELMADGVRDGAAPAALPHFTRARARRVFAAGRAAFQRDWPEAYARDARAAPIRGRFDVAPLPPFEGGGRAGVLAGRNLLISASSRDRRAALLAVDFLTSPRVMRMDAVRFSLAPVLRASYQDRAVRRALRFPTRLEHAVRRAKAPPVSPAYGRISRAIADNVHAALAGTRSAQDALRRADREITRALPAPPAPGQ
jgi:multiple sugar transport system substrate-binding protein